MAKKAKGGKKQTKEPAEISIQNRKVRHDYEILDQWEVGIVLQGSEVKSLREKNLQWADAHARFDNRGELWLWSLYIGEYRQAAAFGHAASAPRKLLLHKRQLRELDQRLQTKGLTLVPSALYFKNGRVKLNLCLVRGKNHGDKRQDLIRRDQDRTIQRAIRDRLR